jgi:cation:H+ antiporter
VRDIVALVAGFTLLYLGGEWLVRSAAGLARSMRVRPLLIGLTVVAFGTSAPEAVVSLLAAAHDRPVLALGNVVGSNIANLGLVLGVAALLRPPRVDAALIRWDVPVLVACAAVVPVVMLDGGIGRGEGALLLLAGFTYVWISIRAATRTRAEKAAREMEAGAEAVGAPGAIGRPRLALVLLGGLAALVVGGEVLVWGAVGLARTLGIGEDVIALTVVAVGTSLPELATTAVAAVRGHGEIAVGNVIGSSIFNVLFVLGGAALVRPIPGEPGGHVVELVALTAFSLGAIAIFWSARRVTRLEGSLLLFGYGLFLALLLARQ